MRSTLFFVLLFFPFLSPAQDSWNTLGSEASSNDGSFSVSIGQLVTDNLIDPQHTVFQGVQVPFSDDDLSVGTLPGISLELYPNPSMDFIYLKSSGSVEASCIRDASGRTVALFNPAMTDLQQADLRDLAPGTYFVHCLVSGQFCSTPFIKQ